MSPQKARRQTKLGNIERSEETKCKKKKKSQKAKTKLTDKDNSVVITRGKGGGR